MSWGWLSTTQVDVAPLRRRALGRPQPIPATIRPMRIVGHGVDLVDIARFERTLANHPERFLERCFTAGEQRYAEGDRRRVERLAGRFAVKEAVLKALGTGWRHGIAWTDIETLPDGAGRPVVTLTGQALRFARDAGVDQWWVSISHTDQHALASAIAVSNQPLE